MREALRIFLILALTAGLLVVYASNANRETVNDDLQAQQEGTGDSNLPIHEDETQRLDDDAGTDVSIDLNGQELIDMFSSPDDEWNREMMGLSEEEYVDYLKQWDTFQYYGDTLYRINMRPYTGTDEYVYMFPYTFTVMKDNTAVPKATGMLLDPNEEFFISDYHSDGDNITMHENYFVHPNKMEPALIPLMRENGWTFSTDAAERTQNGNSTQFKKGDDVVNFSFMGLVSAEEAASWAGKELTVAISNPRCPGLVFVPMDEHVFDKVEDITLAELDKRFANINGIDATR